MRKSLTVWQRKVSRKQRGGEGKVVRDKKRKLYRSDKLHNADEGQKDSTKPKDHKASSRISGYGTSKRICQRVPLGNLVDISLSMEKHPCHCS